jgi:hypothetical protein
MTASASSGDWARRAARVGRCVARFRMATKPEVRAWRATRVATGGARCVGCGDPFQPDEPHVEVVAAQTVILDLHEECFGVWERFAQGGAEPAARGPEPVDDEEDEA